MCYSLGAEGIVRSSKKLILKNGRIKRDWSLHFYSTSGALSDKIVTKEFAVPLGYGKGSVLSDELGQMVDYRNYEDLQILLVDDWRRTDPEFIILTKRNNEIEKFHFDIKTSKYVGISRSKNNVYVMLNVSGDQGLVLLNLDLERKILDSHEFPLDGGFIEATSDVPVKQGGFTVNGDIVYFGIPKFEKNLIMLPDSYISSYNMKTREIKKVDFENESIFSVLNYGNDGILALSLHRDSNKLKILEIDSTLNIKKTHLVDLMFEMDPQYYADRGLLKGSILYVTLDGRYNVDHTNKGKDYLLAYDMKNEKVISLQQFLLKNAKPSGAWLFSSHLYVSKNGVNYNADYEM